jgi:Peptidase M50B-like
VTAEFKRLGRSGSYRLGRLRAQGVSDIRRPVPFKPRFARPDHRWPASVWLLSLVLGVLLIAAGAGADWWFMPFVAGVLAGAANWIGRWPTRAAVTAVVVMAALGWLLPWWWALLRGQPYGEDARIAAVLLGLPGYAAVGLLVTILVSVAQAVVGYWLGRALTPLPARD